MPWRRIYQALAQAQIGLYAAALAYYDPLGITLTLTAGVGAPPGQEPGALRRLRPHPDRPHPPALPLYCPRQVPSQLIYSRSIGLVGQAILKAVTGGAPKGAEKARRAYPWNLIRVMPA